MSVCSKYVSGVRYEGISEGNVEVISDVRVYLATPTADHPKDKAILSIPDAFGTDLVDTKLLADDFARDRFEVYTIDYFDGDHLPSDAPNSGSFDWMAWLGRHVTRPFIGGVVDGLKDLFDLAFDNASHSSLPGVLMAAKTFQETGIPGDRFPLTTKADEYLAGSARVSELYEKEYFRSCEHRFGDLTNAENAKILQGCIVA